MPNNLHPAKWGPREKSFDPLIKDLVAKRGYGVELEYFGAVSEERAETIRRGLRNAGRHLGISVKAFWKPCPQPPPCRFGGAECAYHVYYTAYDPEVARAYKAQQVEASRRSS